MTKPNRKRSSLLKTTLALCVLSTPGFAAVPESKDPITVAQSDWTGIQITSAIVVKLLQKMGYNAKIVPVDATAVFTALQNGDITFDTEAWTSSTGDQVKAALATGKVVKLDASGLVGWDRWWYPDYVKAKCPGLPDWKALNACAAVFKTAETGEKGRLLLFPEDWGGNDDTRVKTLGLNYQVVRAGSEAALLAQVKAAYQRHQPILAWLYSPNWAPKRFKGEFVNLPTYNPDCDAKGFGCEKPKAEIAKLAWASAKTKWPAAYELVTAFKLSNDDYSALTGEVDVDGKKVDAVVDGWLATHEAAWSTWIKK